MSHTRPPALAAAFAIATALVIFAGPLTGTEIGGPSTVSASEQTIDLNTISHDLINFTYSLTAKKNGSPTSCSYTVLADYTTDEEGGDGIDDHRYIDFRVNLVPMSLQDGDQLDFLWVATTPRGSWQDNHIVDVTE